MITTAGSGYAACGRNAVTRWREDVTRDNWGTFIYLRDVRSGTCGPLVINRYNVRRSHMRFRFRKTKLTSGAPMPA